MRSPRFFRSKPIRIRLLSLILIISLPAFAIIVSSGLDQRSVAIAEAQGNALLVVQSLAAQQEQVATATKMMLIALSQMNEVKNLDATASSMLFRQMNDQYPFYSVILAVTPDGNVFASSLPYEPGAINLADRKHVKDAMNTLDFSVGEYIKGRISNSISLNYTYPVFDTNRRLIAILIAGFKLDEYARFISRANLTKDYAIVITDYKGVRLSRFPENDATAVGTPISAATFEQISSDKEQGVFETTAKDGVMRIYAFRRLSLKDGSPPYLYILTGISKGKILQMANLKMFSNLWKLGIVTSIAMFFAWIFGNSFFIKPINRLSKATQHFAQGELGIRTGLPHTADELGQLAQSFDVMASLLEEREIALRKAHSELEARVEERTAELKHSGELMSLIMQSMGEGIFGSDEEGRCTFVNEAAATMLGYSVEEVLGHPVHDLFHHSHADGTPYALIDCPMFHSARQGTTTSSEDEVLWRKDGSLFAVAYISAPLRKDDLIIGAVVVFRDITERKKMQEDLLVALDKAEAAARAKSEFLANMSHEIRTPMNGIIGMTGLLLDTALEKDQREYAATIENSANALMHVINDILDYSKIEAGKLDMETIDFDLRVTMEDIGELMGMKAHEKGLQYTCFVDPEVSSLLRGDPGRLRQIMINLAGNAIKFVSKGEVAVHVTLEEEDDTHAKVRFTIRDTGIGIPKDRMDRLFQSFSQVDASTTRKYGGTGLGLSISKQLVEMMGGEIGVESEEGKGSTFWFTAIFEKRPECEEQPFSFPADIRDQRILIVDDNATNRFILTELLRSCHR